MSELMRTALFLIAIAALVVLAQTLDYNDQQQMTVAAPSEHYLAWREEMLKATRGTAEEERKAYIARLGAENPELVRIINTQWHSPKNQKVAQK